MNNKHYLEQLIQALEHRRESSKESEIKELKLSIEQFAKLKLKADFEDCNIAEIKNRFPNYIDSWGDEQPWYIEDDVSVVKNLLVETLCKLLEHGKTPLNVVYVGNSNCSVSWDDFVKVAENIDYYGGYGRWVIELNLKVVGDDWWLERYEYDGSEWWEFKTLPKRPPEKAATGKEIKCMILSCERYTHSLDCSHSDGKCPRKMWSRQEVSTPTVELSHRKMTIGVFLTFQILHQPFKLFFHQLVPMLVKLLQLLFVSFHLSNQLCFRSYDKNLPFFF